MADSTCFYCLKKCDSSIGHYCINGLFIPGVSNRYNTIQADASNYSVLCQASSHGPCDQVNETAMLSADLVNTNTEFSNEHKFPYELTHGTDQPTHSSQDCVTGGASNILMGLDSEESYQSHWAIDNASDQKLFNNMEQGANDSNTLMNITFSNTELSSNVDHLTSKLCQLTVDKNNLSKPAFSNPNNTEFTEVGGSISNIATYDFPVVDKFGNVQTGNNIENGESRFVCNPVNERYDYDMSGLSYVISVIDKERSRINHELMMGNSSDTENTMDGIQLTKMYCRFSKSDQITETVPMKDDLDSMKNNFTFSEAEQSRNIVFSNVPIQGYREQTDSINDEIRNDRTIAEMMQHKCSNANKDGKLGLNYVNLSSCTDGSALIKIPCTEIPETFDDCPMDAGTAFASPSSLQLDDSYSSNCLKEFQPSGNILRNSVDQHIRFKKDIISHEVTKKYKCDICEKSFSSKGSLQRHALTHRSKKPFDCKFCGKSFSRKDNLKTHALTHTGDKPFCCELCAKSFISQTYLKKHTLIHKRDKPYECMICGKKFLHKSNLNRHRNIHTGIKRNKFDVCEKSFCRKRSLLRHALTHTSHKPFECKICKKTFRHRSNLYVHDRIHTNKRPYVCEYCGKSFNQKHHLQTHTLLHTGEKPHRCMICGKKFSDRSILRRHRKLINLNKRFIPEENIYQIMYKTTCASF